MKVSGKHIELTCDTHEHFLLCSLQTVPQCWLWPPSSFRDPRTRCSRRSEWHWVKDSQTQAPAALGPCLSSLPPRSPSSGHSEAPASDSHSPLGLCTCCSPLKHSPFLSTRPSHRLPVVPPSSPVTHLQGLATPRVILGRFFTFVFVFNLLFFKPVPSPHFGSIDSDTSGGEV